MRMAPPCLLTTFRHLNPVPKTMMRGVAFILGAGRVGACVALALLVSRAAEPNGNLRELIEQNQRLQEQIRAQQKTIDELNAMMGEVVRASDRHERELQSLQSRTDSSAPSRGASSNRDQEVRISAEAGLAFFKTGSEGQFPGASFRADDPVIAIEVPVAKRGYFFSELKLLTRDTNVENFELGEIYVDFEDVSAAWGQPGFLSFRAGRLNIPFGHEYERRSPVANPLISHSLSDIWGADEGVEIYGRIGPARYVLAVQNGGVSRLRDATSDKSVVGRIGWDPSPWLQLSGSAMRTGDLATVADNLSEIWFANGFFRALGPALTTATFHVTLLEADATLRWKNGQINTALGQVRFDDSDTLSDNSRRLDYGYLEMTQAIAAGLYGAVRYSEIRAPHGYPLAGWGKMGTFFFRPVLTTELQRTSLGLGYRIAPPLVLKFEYTWESGRMITGAGRDHENFFGSQIAVKF